MIIHYKNYLEDAILTAENIPFDQDIYNLKIPHLSRTFSQVNNYPTLPFISMDLQSAKAVRSFIVDIGNLKSTTVVTLLAANNSSFTSPETFTLTYANTCFYWQNTTAKTYRYWRLRISDTSLSTITLGVINIGDYLVLPGIDPGTTLSFNTTSSRDLSISGQTFGDLGYQYLSTTFDFPFVPETNWLYGGKTIANRKDIITMWETVQNSMPVWLFIWENSLSTVSPIFCVLNQSSIEFKKSQLNWATSISFLEVK